MGCVDFVKAVVTRIIFGIHGLLAIWRVTSIKEDPYYWYLFLSLLLLFFEGVFTIAIKANQEWKWFCPSVFFYLTSVVPAIWLLELDKFYLRVALREERVHLNATSSSSTSDTNPDLEETLVKIGIDLPVKVANLSAEMWVTIIEQFLMLVLIIGRWMLPLGDLTRDELSQLLLVYIGTAADIIEFFDSFKDERVAYDEVLVLMVLSIWSWSLMQFTLVLTATKGRQTRMSVLSSEDQTEEDSALQQMFCSIDVWAILINIILQDAPFLAFRMLLIFHYRIISYMNVFFTAKNTLVIALQFYRLVVVQIEKWSASKRISKPKTFSDKELSPKTKNYDRRKRKNDHQRLSGEEFCNRRYVSGGERVALIELEERGGRGGSSCSSPLRSSLEQSFGTSTLRHQALMRHQRVSYHEVGNPALIGPSPSRGRRLPLEAHHPWRHTKKASGFLS
ncbi:transmembrane protein 26-like [Oratosquilla oratoria]|uniref:transmembrane protein 26-like n=1 Tax=Oratosquilla oratoria TaxID=337810 RepID=UPI003F770885